MNHQDMNLNIRYDLPDHIWQSVIPEIYEALDGWLGFEIDKTNPAKGLPHWFSFNETKKHIMASVEPGGLLFTGLMPDNDWETWKLNIKRIATKKLGFKVGEIELGEVDY